MSFIDLNATTISDVDPYKPIEQTDAEQGASQTNFIVIEDGTGWICNGTLAREHVWKGIVVLGVLQEVIVIYYRWQLAHFLERLTKSYWKFSKSVVMAVK